MLLTFLTTLIVHSVKKSFIKLVGNLSVWHARKKEQTEYLEYSLLMTKTHYISL